MSKIYWVIVGSYAVHRILGETQVFETNMQLIRGEILKGEVPNWNIPTDAQVAAFLMKDKETFERTFGTVACQIIPCDNVSEETRDNNLNRAQAMGFELDNTSSGFVTWWS